MASLLSNLQNSKKKGELCPVFVPVYSLDKPTLEEKADVSWTSKVTVKEEMRTFTDVDKFASLEEFSKQLEIYAHENKKIIRKRKHGAKPVELHKPSCSYVTEACICSALTKSVQNKEFWSTKGLKSLIESHLITQGLHEVMFQCIYKYNAIDILKTLAKSKKNISEKYIVKTIKHIVSLLSKDDIEKLSLSMYWEECPVPTDVANNLLNIVMLPFNVMELKRQLKILTSGEALVLVQFFHYLLHLVSPALINTDHNFIVPREVTEIMVMSWIDALLTAHFVSFTTSPTLRALMSELKKTTVKQKRFYKDISMLAPYLEHFKKHFTLPERSFGKYSIEMITL